MNDKQIDGMQTDEKPVDESLEEQVYEAIKRAIIHRELKPGEQISYTTWARQLGVSRTPVRDAFKRLEGEGFIIRESERQWHVYTLTLADVHDLHAARMAVEGYMARLSAHNRSPEQVETMMDLVEQMEAAMLERDRATFMQCDARFHELIGDACQNPYLARTSIRLREMLARLRTNISVEGRLQVALEENKAISHAILAQDEDGAEAAQRKHIAAARDNMVHLLEQMVIPIVGDKF